MPTATKVVADDPLEMLYERGVTDGLPVVPPTRERVERMLAGAPGRRREELIGLLGPCYGEATAEKVAINAVMAGCRPEYFPVVLAGVEALCDERLCAPGLSVTLLSGAPLAIVNGPVRHTIGLNCGQNALGHGFRANATIGRALRLVILNIGGARPHGLTKATMGHPGQYTFLVAEDEETSPWEPFHVGRGFQQDDSAITLFPAIGFQQVIDFQSTTAEQLVASLGWAMAGGVWSHKDYPLLCDAVLVLSPEYAKAIARDGWSKQDVRQFLYGTIKRPLEELKPGKDGGGGLSESVLRSQRRQGLVVDGCMRKFRSPDSILIVVAGGTAGSRSSLLVGQPGTWMPAPR